MPGETPPGGRREREALERWAAGRGLEFREEDLLPPASRVLRQGLGAGEHRAARATRQTPGSLTATGGLRVWPERVTLNLCSGVLPGGLDGMLGHHAHLELRTSPDGGRRWYALFDTVVFARLPERSRVVCEFSSWPGDLGSVQSLATVDVSRRDGPADQLVLMPEQLEERGGRAWRISPPEPVETLETLIDAALPALASAPQTTGVELVDGVLCVSATGALTDPVELEALCAVAASVAGGVRAVAERRPDIEPTSPLGPPRDTPRARWIAEGVETVQWPAPPASVGEAIAAYGPVARAQASRSGRIAGGAVLGVGLVVALLCLLGGAVGVLLLRDLLAAAAGLGAALVVLAGSVGAARQVRGEVAADVIASRARPWGLEAFARGYASTRRLALEDHEELRRHFRSPLPGRPMRAFHGNLGDGVSGHLALWVERPPDGPARHWLLAAVQAPASPVAAPPGYFAERAGDVLVVGREVAEEDRSAAQLDALAAVARGLAAARPAA